MVAAAQSDSFCSLLNGEDAFSSSSRPAGGQESWLICVIHGDKLRGGEARLAGLAVAADWLRQSEQECIRCVTV